MSRRGSLPFPSVSTARNFWKNLEKQFLHATRERGGETNQSGSNHSTASSKKRKGKKTKETTVHFKEEEEEIELDSKIQTTQTTEVQREPLVVNDGKEEVEEMEEMEGMEQELVEERSVEKKKEKETEINPNDYKEKEIEGEQQEQEQEKKEEKRKDRTVATAQWESVQVELSWLRMMMEEFSKKSDKRISLLEDSNKRVLEDLKQVKEDLRNLQRTKKRNGDTETDTHWRNTGPQLDASIWVRVFSLLNKHDLGIAMSVCHTWSKIVLAYSRGDCEMTKCFSMLTL